MPPFEASTIVAVATGPARGGIGVVRLSGPRALALGRAVAPGLPEAPEPRHAYFTALRDAAGAALDEGLALYFRAPHSYTGEDVVELQAHGGPRLLALLVEAVLSRGTARPAEAGEFTRRAFLNGRLDLTRAEAVAELVAAESEAQVRAAAAQLTGGLAVAVQAVRGPLLALGADLEAALDFPDEAEGADAALEGRLAAAAQQLDALLVRCRQGALLRRGAQVVLFGPVNAGKSTLFNLLVGEDRALVDEAPGTTRDALFARVEWQGLAVTLVDTAGLRPSPGRVEALGIARAQAAVASADLALLLLPPEATAAQAQAWKAAAATAAPVLEVWGKSDTRKDNKNNELHVSGLTGAGVEALRARIASLLLGGVEAAVALGGARHLDALARAAEALARAQAARVHSTLEVVAGEVGLGLAALAEVTGEDASADLLDAVFRRFCIGK